MVNSKGEVEIFSDIQQSMALGGITDGVTNMELNAAYATIANGGAYIEPALYSQILDHDGNVLLDRTNPVSRQVIKETTAYLLTDAMVDVVTKGTGGSVNFGNMSIAGKTGTTTSYRDVWFSGYTPYYTATTWTGYDNNEVLNKNNGERDLSKKLWRAVMSRIHEELENEPFTRPQGIVSATVCSQSGKLPIAGVCDGSLTTELFAEGTVPTEYCDLHYQGNICMATGRHANDACPFKAPGIMTLAASDDGTLATTSNQCPHTIDYYTNHPDQLVSDSQAMQAAQAAQQAAAQQAAAQQAAAEAAAAQQAAQEADPNAPPAQ